VPALVLALLAVVVHLRTRHIAAVTADRGPAITVATARELFPAAAELGAVSPGQPIPVLSDAGQVLGALLDTTPFASAHPGYAGPVPAVVGLSPDGRVVGVRLLPNADSPTFVEFVIEEGLLERWNGLLAAQAAAAKVDAVSGATMTSQALIGPVRQVLGTVAAVPAAPAPTMRPAWTDRLVWAALALGLLSFLAGDRLPRLRLLVLRPVNVVVLGFLAGSCLSLALGQGWLAGGAPWGRFPLLVGLAAAAVLIPVLTGRNFYCPHVCPYGSAQDLVSRLWRWRRPVLPRWLGDALRLARGGLLLAVVAMLLLPFAFDLTAVEPFAAFQWRSAPAAALTIAGVFLLLGVVFPRLWCRHLCPTGYLLETCRGRCPVQGETPRGLSFERGALLAALGTALLLAWRPLSVPTPPTEAALHPVTTALAQSSSANTVPDVLTVIHQRRSVRHYTGAPVRPAQLDTLVRAAMAAPTAGNAQPWAFVVVTERARLRGLADALPYGKMLPTAGAAIVVCGVPAKALPGAAASFWVQDCAAAAENVLLAAQGIGLGAVWLGVYPLEDRMAGVRDACSIPTEVSPVCVISLGVSAGIEEPKDKYSSANVHWETW